MPSSSLKYLQVAEYLRRQIRRGVWTVGDRLPSHTEVRARFACTQHTVERAHALLEKDGLIERRHRKGVFVAALAPASEAPASDNKGPAMPSWISDTIVVASLYGHDARPPRDSGWEDSVIQGALSVAQGETMHTLLLHPSQLLPEKITRLSSHPPKGIVLSLSSFHPRQAEQILRGLKSTSIPIVVYGNAEPFSDYDMVISDHVAGARKLTHYLLSRGCRRILNLQFEDSQVLTYWQPERQAGYELALQEAGLKPLPTCRVQKQMAIDASNETEESLFFDAVAYLISRLRPHFQDNGSCDALLVESDGLVAPVAAACRFIGLEPGRDILIAGYDNYWIPSFSDAAQIYKPVATVDKHNWRLGATAVQLLLARIRGLLPETPQRRIIEPDLVVLDDISKSLKPQTKSQKSRDGALASSTA
jgi:DNA-binding LacI/PurR family transcriptional regulator